MTVTTIKFKPGKLYRIRGQNKRKRGGNWVSGVTFLKKSGGFHKCSFGEILMFLKFDIERDVKGENIILDLYFLDKDGKILIFEANKIHEYKAIKWWLMPINNNNQKEKENATSVHTKV